MSGVWLSVAAGVVFNFVSLLGVLVFGWPPGNVFALFWIENAVLGLVTLVKVASARAPSNKGITVNGRERPGSPMLFALFFMFHYGIFCVVHGVFTGIIAWKIGFEASFALLGLPVVLLLIRYTVETLTTWVGPNGLRWQVSPQQAMMAPYPRIVVLHLAAILGFGVVLGNGFGLPAGFGSRVMASLPLAWRTDGVLLVIVLLLIKTVVDVGTTLKAVRTR